MPAGGRAALARRAAVMIEMKNSRVPATAETIAHHGRRRAAEACGNSRTLPATSATAPNAVGRPRPPLCRSGTNATMPTTTSASAAHEVGRTLKP